MQSLFTDNRGFMTANGQPDQSRSSRYVLKDYVNGKLLFCHAPPGRKQEEFHTYAPRIRRELQEAALPAQQQRAMRVDNFTLAESALKLHSFTFLNNFADK